MIIFDEKQYKRIDDFAKARHISVGQAIRDAVGLRLLAMDRKGDFDGQYSHDCIDRMLVVR